MIQNRLGTVYGDQDDPFSQQKLLDLIQNVYTLRSDHLRSTLESRKDVNKECDYPETANITVNDYRTMYDRSALGARVVEVLPEECWQVSPLVYEDEDSETETDFEAALKELSKSLRGEQSWYGGDEGSPLWEYLSRADKLSGIGHYGVIVLGLDDGKPLHEPVDGFQDPENGKAGGPAYVSNAKRKGAKLLYLSAFDEGCLSTSGVEFETNRYSARYRKPKWYNIDLTDTNDTSQTSVGRETVTVKVHWSRVIHVCDNLGSSEILGIPRMRPVWNHLLDSRKIYGAAGEGFWRGAILRMFYETHPQLGGDVTVDEDSLRDAIWNMENGLQRWLLLKGMSGKPITPAVTDPTPHINVLIDAICIKLGIPVRIFKGSERGELASGQDDQTWNDRVRARRRGYLTPRLIVPFIDRLIQVGVLPEPNQKLGYKVEWDDPEQLKPQEKAALAATKTDALVKYIGGQGDALVQPLDYLTRFLDIEEEEAQGILERAVEGQQEKVGQEAELKQARVDAGLETATPPETPPEEGTPEGGGEEPPEEEQPKPTNSELADNAFCPTGTGGGIKNTCSPHSPLAHPVWKARLDRMKGRITDARAKLSAAVNSKNKKGVQRGKRRLKKLYETLGRMARKYDDRQEGSGGVTAGIPSHGGYIGKFLFGGIANQQMEGDMAEWYDLLTNEESGLAAVGLEPLDNANCGTGAGGFKPGNKCARGGNGGASGGSGSSAIGDELIAPPPPGQFLKPDVTQDSNGDGVTDRARVGVAAHEVPPPPQVPQLPNLTPHERAVEEAFRDAFHKDPDGVAGNFRSVVLNTTKPGEPPTFGTDDAKVLTTAWGKEGMSLEERSQNRATLNLALHQTANAVAKRAAVQHMDTLQPGDEIMVTVGGCGAGKGYALKNVPQALEMKQRSKMVWDSAGDQNATENTWLLQEAEKRGLKVNYVYVHADPRKQWADPERGVVKRAQDPQDGRMVDAFVFADSYALGAKNHQAFHQANKDNPNANFVFLDNTGKPKLLDGIPKEALDTDRHELAAYALGVVASRPEIPPHVRRGATMGVRIWEDDAKRINAMSAEAQQEHVQVETNEAHWWELIPADTNGRN